MATFMSKFKMFHKLLPEILVITESYKRLSVHFPSQSLQISQTWAMSYFLSRILIKERSNLTESHFDHKNISSKRFVQIICMDTRISILGYSYLNPVIKFSEELGVFAYFEHVLTHVITPNFKWQSYFLS